MTDKRFYILIPFFVFFAFSPAFAANDFIKSNSDEPMEITSNRMEAFNEKKMVIFSGNAKVIQGNSVLKSDKIILYYKKDPEKKDKVGTIETDATGELDRVEAKGNVSLIQGERTALGEEAVFVRESNKVILTGNAVLKEGKNTIRGDRVIVFLNEDRGVVESDSQKQVKAIIYPREKKKDTK
jgi:lipopolysaccharide export system protein LptA